MKAVLITRCGASRVVNDAAGTEYIVSFCDGTERRFRLTGYVGLVGMYEEIAPGETCRATWGSGLEVQYCQRPEEHAGPHEATDATGRVRWEILT